MDHRLLVVALLISLLRGASAATLTITNACNATVWAGIWTNEKFPQLPAGIGSGFPLDPAASRVVDAPAGWMGRVWARTRCELDNSGVRICKTGGCPGSSSTDCVGKLPKPPVTLVGFTLSGPAGGGRDEYFVDLVQGNGFNVPVSVQPPAGSGCGVASCPADINAICPPELLYSERDGKGGWTKDACMSACYALSDPAECCWGDFSGPDKCKPTDYSRMFKKACPAAKSYLYDDGAVFSCTGGSNYVVAFCPPT